MESRQSGDGSAAAATERPDAADAPGDLRERVPLHRRDVERVAVPDREDPGRVAPGSRRRPSRSAGSARQVGEPVVADRRAPVDPESPEGGDLTAVPARGATRPVRAVPAVPAAHGLDRVRVRVSVHRLTGQEAVRVRPHPAAPKASEARGPAVAGRARGDPREEVERPLGRRRRARRLNSRGAPSVPAVAADARPCGRRPSVPAMAPEDIRNRVRRHIEAPDSESDHAAGRPAVPAAAAVTGGTGGAVSTLASP